MSDDTGSSNKVTIGIIIILFIFLGLLVANTVFNQGKIQELQSQVETTKKQVAATEQEIEKAKQELAKEAQKQAEAVAESFADIDSPIARFALVKRYYAKIAAALTPESKKQLDSIIIFVEKQPVVLVDPTQMPASYSAQLVTIKSELKTAKAAAATKKVPTDEAASPSAVIGKTVSLTGTLSFVKDDPVLGGSYFKLTDTNFGEPYYLYLNPTTTAQAKATMEGKVVTVQVKVTGQKDGFYSYDVVSGPTLAS